MIDVVQQSLFDYASLDADTREFVQEKAQAIHTRLKRTAEDVIAIGQDLTEVNAVLAPLGKFHNWIRSEFDMTRQTAYRFMHVAQRFGGCNNLLQLNPSPSALYALADASEEVVEKVQSGEIPPTYTAIQEVKHVDPASLPVLKPEPGPIYGTVYQQPTPTAVYAPSISTLRTPNTYEGGSIVRTPVEIDRTVHDEDPLPVVTRGVPAALQSSDSNEWYTPAEYVNAARELMGGIDIDPASCDFANKIVQAKNFYAKNGLTQSWDKRVWLNPPYGFDGGRSNQELWSSELIQRHEAGLVTEAVLLVNANTEAKWFQPLYDYFICFTHHRIRFYNTSGESSQPTQGNALVYFGKDKNQQNRFIEIFSRFGVVVRRADGR